MLTKERLVTRTRGRGTFVSDRSRENRLNRAVVSNINGLFRYLNTVGESTRLKVISLDKGEAPPRNLLQHEYITQAELVRSVRVRALDGRPYSLSIAYRSRKSGLAEAGGSGDDQHDRSGPAVRRGR